MCVDGGKCYPLKRKSKVTTGQLSEVLVIVSCGVKLEGVKECQKYVQGTDPGVLFLFYSATTKLR